MIETDEPRGVAASQFLEPWNRATVADEASDPLVGTTLSDTYLVERVLGEGGMGRVYLARHTRIAQKRVAVKVLRQEFVGNTEVLARFQREAEAAAAISHPNVVTVFDVARTPAGQPYLVCEYLDGIDLSEHLNVHGKLEPSEAVHIARQICRGLAAAHRSSVIHRDLKPQNVFLVGDFTNGGPARPDVKILDFGLSRFVTPASENPLTQSGVIMGTPAYMAPEQARAQPVDGRADVYGVGAILFTVLTGRPPFVADTPQATVLAVLHGDPPPPRSIEPRIPEALEAILLRALARDPSQRYADAAALERALDAFESQQLAVSLPPRMALLPEMTPIVQAYPSLAPLASPRWSFLLYLLAAVILFVSAAASTVPGVELAAAYRFNRVEIGLFLLAIVGTALTPGLFWFSRKRKILFENGVEVAAYARELRTGVLTFVVTYGLSLLCLHLVDGCLVVLLGGSRVTPAGANFAGWNLLLPLLALTAALGRIWVERLLSNVRPGWRRLLATWSVASVVFMSMGSTVVIGLHWLENTRDRASPSARGP